MNAMERLNERVKSKGVLLAGLDPDIDKILSINEETAEFSKNSIKSYELIDNFCYSYIQAIKDEVAAIKINIAFF